MSSDVSVLVNGVDVDECLIQTPVQVAHGRSDISTQPDPPTASLVYESEFCDWQLGDDLQIWAATYYLPATYDDPVVTYDDERAVYDSDAEGKVWTAHFAGRIASLEPSAAGGRVQTWRVEAVGYQAELGYRPIQIITPPRPAESDVARVQAIADAAGMPIPIQGAAGVQLAAGTIDSDALSALHDVCQSTGGLLWQDRRGRIIYGTAAHRASTSKPVGVLDCSTVDDDLSWSQGIEDIVNEVRTVWGPADARQESVHRDAASVAKPWGVRRVDVDTLCAAEADAEQLGLLILARRAFPYWRTLSVAVDVGDPAASRLLSRLDMSTPVLVPIPVTPGPQPVQPPVPVVVEGWVETWDESGYSATASFSDQKRWVTTSLRNYGEVLAGGTYGHWLAAGDYLNMLVKEAA